MSCGRVSDWCSSEYIRPVLLTYVGHVRGRGIKFSSHTIDTSTMGAISGRTWLVSAPNLGASYLNLHRVCYAAFVLKINVEGANILNVLVPRHSLRERSITGSSGVSMFSKYVARRSEDPGSTLV